ncbi:uncharacterized protein [Drosophila kikkawai]
MNSSNAGDLIKSLEDLEVMGGNKDSLSEGDLVFAQSKGYTPWPGILVAKQSSHSIVSFLGTDETRKIRNLKIWPYSENSKAEFITVLNLEYGVFRDAIIIAEELSSQLDKNKERGAYCYRVLKKNDRQEQQEQKKRSQKEASQEDASQKEASQEEASKKKPSKVEPSKEEPSKEEPKHVKPNKEESNHVKPSKKEFQQEKPSKKEPNQQPDNLEELGFGEIDEGQEISIKYVQFLRSNRDSLNGGVEKKFIELVNVLRSSLKINQKDYPSAVLALQELHEMTFSELLLVRNFEAVNSIYCISFLDTSHQNYVEAAQVKVLAKQLINRFDLVFDLPDINGPFIDYLRSLSSIYMRYTYALEPIEFPSSKEESCQETLDPKVAEQEALDVKESKEEAFDLEELLEDKDFLAIELEDKFDKQIDILRRSLSFRRKDYAAAVLAFEELLSMTFTKDFLYPKYKDINFIYYISRSGSVLPWSGLAKATFVRNLANQLMARILSVFNIKGITSYDFMIRFGALYSSNSSDIPDSSDSSDGSDGPDGPDGSNGSNGSNSSDGPDGPDSSNGSEYKPESKSESETKSECYPESKSESETKSECYPESKSESSTE